MRKPNGTTIMEVLISICIIALVMAVLFNLLVQVRNEDVSNQIQSNYVINQSTIIKEVEDDIGDFGIKSVSSCVLSEANVTTDLLNHGYENKFKCLKIEYAADYIEDRIGFLMIYNTYAKFDVVNGKYVGRPDSATWMVQYVRGRYTKYSGNVPILTSWKNGTQNMKEYPDEVDLSERAYMLYTAASGSAQNAASLVIPIRNSDGEHYDLNFGFIFTGNSYFKCKTSNNNMFQCRCDSSAALCQKTYN